MPTLTVAIITGTRAEFGIWTPILRGLQGSKKLRPRLIVTGMHLQKKFGHTLRDIEAAGFPIAAKVPMYQPRDTPADSLARATAALAKTFARLKPDLVLLLGDRLEMLAAANAALACQLPIAHLHGGETAPGQWDEQIRHAITKMAHLHFPATRLAARRIAQMGEDPKSIHTIGAPALDTTQGCRGAMLLAQSRGQKHVLCGPDTPLSPLPSPRALLLLHPSSANESLEERRTRLLLCALKNVALPFLAVGPNNDPGHAGILRAYEKNRTAVTMNLPQQDFWRLMNQSALLIGNSSSGIIEAASFGVPVINLGDRQQGRERNPNVIDVPWPASSQPIEKAIHRALTHKPFLAQVARRHNLYGDGHAAERLVRVLESLTPPLPIVKRFHDV